MNSIFFSTYFFFKKKNRWSNFFNENFTFVLLFSKSHKMSTDSMKLFKLNWNLYRFNFLLLSREKVATKKNGIKITKFRVVSWAHFVVRFLVLHVLLFSVFLLLFLPLPLLPYSIESFSIEYEKFKYFECRARPTTSFCFVLFWFYYSWIDNFL